MLKRLCKLLFVFAQMGEVKRLHYKMVTVSGEKGCVEGVISDKRQNGGRQLWDMVTMSIVFILVER